MALADLIRQLIGILDEADVAADAGNVEKAREYLGEMKDLLDVEFLKD